MKNKFYLLLAFITIISACNSNPKSTESSDNKKDEIPENSRTSLEWKGVYRGVLPCADCEGIETEIKIDADLSYVMSSKYLGENEEVFKEKGTFTWDEAGFKITLKNADSTAITKQYLVGENMLFMLDADGNKIEGELKEKYQLKKVLFDNTISEKYWKLIELNEKKIILEKNQDTAPHLILNDENSLVYGNGGCNDIHGFYELAEGNKIKFSKIATTKMFCNYMEMEQALLNVLERTDNYSVKNDTVTLKNATMVSLAKFQLIYAKE